MLRDGSKHIPNSPMCSDAGSLLGMENFQHLCSSPSGSTCIFSKASVALQDEIQMHLLKENWNKIKPYLRITEISPLLPDTHVLVLLFGLCVVQVVNNL